MDELDCAEALKYAFEVVRSQKVTAEEKETLREYLATHCLVLKYEADDWANHRKEIEASGYKPALNPEEYAPLYREIVKFLGEK